MNCQNCGSQLKDEDRFCPSCGAKRASTALQPVDHMGPPHNHSTWTASSPKQLQRKAANHRPVQEVRSRPNANQHDDFRLMGAYSRSFTTPAVITLVLYFVLWIPGFIANIVYLREANKVKELTGEAPEGRGCLLAMLAVFTILLVSACVIWLAIFGALGAGSTTS